MKRGRLGKWSNTQGKGRLRLIHVLYVMPEIFSQKLDREPVNGRNAVGTVIGMDKASLA
jgi:hypothetical protein